MPRTSSIQTFCRQGERGATHFVSGHPPMSKWVKYGEGRGGSVFCQRRAEHRRGPLHASQRPGVSWVIHRWPQNCWSDSRKSAIHSDLHRLSSCSPLQALRFTTVDSKAIRIEAVRTWWSGGHFQSGLGVVGSYSHDSCLRFDRPFPTGYSPKSLFTL